MNKENTIRVNLEQLSATERFLSDFIEIPSLSGNEQEAMVYLEQALTSLDIDVERINLSDSISEDEDYSDPINGIGYEGRFNLRAIRKGSGAGKNLLFNTHVDVVPPSAGMESPWDAQKEGNKIFGRGACDAKGQIAALFLALQILDDLNIKLAGDVIAHFVVEEENGGNGSLAMVRRGEQADGCVCLEPSECNILTSIRGAVWFKLILKGKAGHSGQPGETKNAIIMARDAMAILEAYHDRLLEESRGIAFFDEYSDPMPLTFGRLESGEWPATAPDSAVLEGVMGLLPNKTSRQVCDEMHHALASCGKAYLANNFELSFTFRHDGCVIDPNHEVPQRLLAASCRQGFETKFGAALCSSDAWLYSTKLGIPTVQFGPGSLKVCHSKDENIEMNEIKKAAEILARFMIDYCGVINESPC